MAFSETKKKCWQYNKLSVFYKKFYLKTKNIHPYKKEGSPHPHSAKKESVLDMTLNWWGPISGDLGSVKNLFIAITPRFTQTWNDSTC